MALVLAATGLFLYLRLRADLDDTLSQGLYSRSNDISALVQSTETGLRDAARKGTSGSQTGGQFAQILDPSGRVFDASTGFQRRALLSSSQLQLAQRGTTTFDLASASPGSGSARVLATPVHAQGRRLVVVVGTSLRDRNQALADITALLLIGGPIALLLAALAGYGLASAALRPVESMRARAAAISTDDLDQRLPLSPSRDELHRLGTTLNEMLTRLEAGVVRERGFVADASHELRTPLAMLRTELELIVRDRPTGEDLDRAVAAAIGDTDRLARLADDLLVMARSDREQFSIAPRPLQVADLLAEVQRRHPHEGVAPQALGESRVPPDLEVRADRDRLLQALINMVDNALRYGAAPVRLEALERDGLVELHVTDAGPGFPPEFLGHAFERFARGDASHTTDGSGLGLAIVQTIARKHGGSAHAANRPGGGADVWIAIPRTGNSRSGSRTAPRPRQSSSRTSTSAAGTHFPSGSQTSRARSS
jgi:signal transduction histidine kinase